MSGAAEDLTNWLCGFFHIVTSSNIMDLEDMRMPAPAATAVSINGLGGSDLQYPSSACHTAGG